MTALPKPQQLTLCLPHHTALGLEDFYESSSNTHALNTLLKWPNWIGDKRIAILNGPNASGKTHMAHVWMQICHAHLITLDDKSVFNSQNGCFVLENIDQIDTPQEEEKLFHLYNHVHNSGGWLLMTSSRPVAQISLSLADLQSRLKNTLMLKISEPDDALLRAVLIKNFQDRQITIDEPVLNYCLTRMERSFSAAIDMVNQLDQQSLSEKRSITIPMIKNMGVV